MNILNSGRFGIGAGAGGGLRRLIGNVQIMYGTARFLFLHSPFIRSFIEYFKQLLNSATCFDFRGSCRARHIKETVQQEFIRIWTDSGITIGQF